jgi:hypothetical protein
MDASALRANDPGRQSLDPARQSFGKRLHVSGWRMVAGVQVPASWFKKRPGRGFKLIGATLRGYSQVQT